MDKKQSKSYENMNKREKKRYEKRFPVTLRIDCVNEEHAALYKRVIEAVDKFYTTPLITRLDNFTKFLEEAGNGVSSDRVLRTKDAIENADKMTSIGGTTEYILNHSDDVSKAMLPAVISGFLYLRMMECLWGGDCPTYNYQEYLRLNACLEEKASADLEEALKDIWKILHEKPRKKWMKITPGGSSSPLTDYVGALCWHKEQVHPIWKNVKKYFREKGTGKNEIEEIQNQYKDLGKGERWACSDRVGLPLILIERAAKGVELNGNYDSNPENISYQHAAFRCLFEIDEFSVKQIKRICFKYKKDLEEGKLTTGGICIVDTKNRDTQ